MRPADPGRRGWPAALLGLVLVTSSCRDAERDVLLGAPRAVAADPALDAKVRAFETSSGRRVRVVPAPDAVAVVALAARGDVDAAVVDPTAPLAAFEADHGRVVGAVRLGGAEHRVLVVDPKLHPKVDPRAAELGAALVAP